jgi:hypothetical protein
MTQSMKLGIASVVLLSSILIPPFSNWRYPITFACVGLSGLLGVLASQQGSKWWLTVPGTTGEPRHVRRSLGAI